MTMKIKWFLCLAVFLIYEKTVINQIPCGQWQVVPSTNTKIHVSAVPICAEKTVTELYREKFKSKKEAEAHKTFIEIPGYEYRIEEGK